MLRLVADALDAAGATDDGTAALEAVKAMLAENRLDADVAAAAIPDGYLVRRSLTRARARGIIAEALADAELAQDRPVLIPIDEIDSFARVRQVGPTDVRNVPMPLDILEDDFKIALHRIVDEPFVAEHSAAELADVFTSSVVLGGRLVRSGFMLKGRGLGKPVMRMRDLGSAGNQIVKLSRLPADLLVVQYVGAVDHDVVEHLRQAVLSRRVSGDDATGSYWDGQDCARLLHAHGWLDLSTGRYTGPTTMDD